MCKRAHKKMQIKCILVGKIIHFLFSAFHFPLFYVPLQSN